MKESIKPRTAKWGSGVIDALSNRLQVELSNVRYVGHGYSGYWEVDAP